MALGVKVVLTKDEKEFIKTNHSKLTNQQLADALNLKLTTCRTLCYAMGLYRMRLEYWTDEQVVFLRAHYQVKGDTELAMIFNEKWHKNKGWTKKHIQKKRRYLNLKRSESEKKKIKERNTAMGMFADCAKKRWQTLGVTPVGEVRIWKTKHGYEYPVIKTADGFVHHNLWLWKKHYGDPEKGMVVRPVQTAPIIPDISELYLVTRAEHARLNASSYHGLPEDLKTAIKTTRKILKNLKDE